MVYGTKMKQKKYLDEQNRKTMTLKCHYVRQDVILHLAARFVSRQRGDVT